MLTSLTIEQIRELIDIYPYLLPRNLWTGKVSEDYAYDYIRGSYELPNGWYRLFLLYCAHIKPILIKHNMLNEFRFSQIKEKYGRICLYDFGAPMEVHNMASIFGVLSGYTCQRCGKPAKYETRGWIECLCKNCAGDIDKKYSYRIRRKRVHKIMHFDYSKDRENGKKYIERIPLRKFWREYVKCLTLTDAQFYDYIVEKGKSI